MKKFKFNESDLTKATYLVLERITPNFQNWRQKEDDYEGIDSIGNPLEAPDTSGISSTDFPWFREAATEVLDREEIPLPFAPELDDILKKVISTYPDSKFGVAELNRGGLSSRFFSTLLKIENEEHQKDLIDLILVTRTLIQEELLKIKKEALSIE